MDEDVIAKNLLLDLTCKDCIHIREYEVSIGYTKVVNYQCKLLEGNLVNFLHSFDICNRFEKK